MKEENNVRLSEARLTRISLLQVRLKRRWRGPIPSISVNAVSTAPSSVAVSSSVMHGRIKCDDIYWELAVGHCAACLSCGSASMLYVLNAFPINMPFIGEGLQPLSHFHNTIGVVVQGMLLRYDIFISSHVAFYFYLHS